MSEKSKEEVREGTFTRTVNPDGSHTDVLDMADGRGPSVVNADLEEKLEGDAKLPPKTTAGPVLPNDGSAAGPSFEPLPGAFFGGPAPYQPPMPRGPFVQYHDADGRSYHAVVTAVHDDGSINCHVFPDGPNVVHLKKVPHGYDAGCWGGYLWG